MTVGGEVMRWTRRGDVQVVWGWMRRFNAEGPVALIDRKAPEQAAKVEPPSRTWPNTSSVV